MSVACVLFQLPTTFFILKQRTIMDTTRLMSWSASSTVFSRWLSKDLRCLLWSSGNSMCWQITQSFPLLPMEVFCPGSGCWQLSIRLGVRIWSESSNETPLDFWRNSWTLLSTVAARSKIGQGLIFFAMQSSLAETTTRRCICLVLYSMAFGNRGGSKAVIFRLVGLNTSPLSKSNDSWSGLQRGAALT